MASSTSIDFSSINYHQIYRYVPESARGSIQDKISQLGPSSENDLEIMQRYRFKSTVFLDPSWILKAVRFLFENKLSKLEYAALVLFEDCKNHPKLKFLEEAKDVSESGTFTSITQETIKEFGPDIVQALEKLKFPKDKIIDFVSRLKFDAQGGDMILVVNNSHRTPQISAFEIYLPVGNKKAFYVFSPATLQKFIKLMAQGQNLEGRYLPSYFRAVGLDLMHGLGKSNDFLDVTRRVVTIPRPSGLRGPLINDPSSNDGLGFYLHDINYHILSVACRIPLSHATIYSRIASLLQDKFPKESEQFLDMDFPFYNPVTLLSPDPNQLTDHHLLQFGLIAIRKLPFINKELDEGIIDALSKIPDELKSAGVVLEKNELKKAQHI